MSFNPSSQLVPVAVLSLDQFEQLNYSLGTDYCDLLLQAVVDRLMPYADGEGTVARLNTEQLALILPPVSSREAAVAVAGAVAGDHRRRPVAEPALGTHRTDWRAQRPAVRTFSAA